MQEFRQCFSNNNARCPRESNILLPVPFPFLMAPWSIIQGDQKWEAAGHYPPFNDVTLLEALHGGQRFVNNP